MDSPTVVVLTRGRSRPVCSLLLLAGLALALLSNRSVHAQRLEDGANEFDAKSRPSRFLRNDLFKGTAPANPKDKMHQEAAEIAAKEVVYPLYWETLGGSPTRGKLDKQVADFESRLGQMTKFKAATEVYQHMYCRQVVERALEVIGRGKPMAGISAARMIAAIPARGMERGVPQPVDNWLSDAKPRLAEGNAQYMAETMLSLVENPKMNDGVRYYMLRGLSSLLGLPRQTPPLVKKDTEEKVIQAAMKLVEKKGNFTRSPQRGEVEGFQILRREAVKVVAQSPAPEVGKDRPALILAKMAGNDQAILPLPRIDERIEAAIGLARITAGAAKVPDLQADYAVYQIALAVGEVASQSDADPDAKGKALTRKHPWKVDAARLLEALDGLKANVKTPYAQNVIKQCVGVLLLVEKGSQTGNTLLTTLATNEPPVKSLFKTGADSTVKSAGAK